MLNVNDLESRWIKYKVKSLIPYIVILFSFLIIGLIFYLIILPKTVTHNHIKEVKLQPKKVELQNQVLQIKEEPKKLDENKTVEPILEPVKIKEIEKETEKEKQILVVEKPKKEKIIIKPSLSFMKEMNNNNLPYYNHIETNSNSNSNMIAQNVDTNKETDVDTAQTKEEQPVIESTISIEKRDIESDIAHVIKRFNKNHNPALSLFVAKKYYELKDYKKAYNYSLMTNDLNNKIEISWIIFAKSLVKLNQKEKAIETLNKYIKHSNSSQARVLLDDIESGKFK